MCSDRRLWVDFGNEIGPDQPVRHAAIVQMLAKQSCLRCLMVLCNPLRTCMACKTLNFRRSSQRTEINTSSAALQRMDTVYTCVGSRLRTFVARYRAGCVLQKSVINLNLVCHHILQLPAGSCGVEVCEWQHLWATSLSDAAAPVALTNASSMIKVLCHAYEQ